MWVRRAHNFQFLPPLQSIQEFKLMGGELVNQLPPLPKKGGLPLTQSPFLRVLKIQHSH